MVIVALILSRSSCLCRPAVNLLNSGHHVTRTVHAFRNVVRIGRSPVQSRFWKLPTTQCLRAAMMSPRSLKLLGLSGGTIVAGIAAFGLESTKRKALCDGSVKVILTPDVLEDPTKPESLPADSAFDWNRFWHLLKPELILLAGAIVSALVVAVVNIQIPSLLGSLVDVVSKLSSRDGTTSFMDDMKRPAFKLVYLYCVQGAFTFLYISLLSCIGERMACRLRQDLFASIIRQDIAFFDCHRTGEIINRLTTDVQDFKSSFKLCISQGLRSVTQTAGCIVSLYFISPQMTAIMVVTLPAIILLGTAIGSVLRKYSRIAAAQVAKATSVADEAIGNVRTVRAFAMEPREQELYAEEVEQAAYLSQCLGIGIGAFQGLANLTLNGIVLGIMYMGGYMMSTQGLSPGDLMSFLVATQTIQRSLSQLSLLFGQFVKGISAGARVFEYINITPTISLTGGKIIPFHSLRGDLEFRDVTFAYPTRSERTVLRNFNLRIPAGRVVAICGASGGGKSTIASLLERFYDVNRGQIVLDGHDISTLDPSWLRGRVIGFINQEPVLFATSIMENIRYGRPTATDQEVIEAAGMANADEFIRGFPSGYNTILGERGVTVSGGQKQRIAIARALLKNPSVLILDEATSALDAESEKLVQEALDKVVKGRTVLVIAHRLSTIQNADMIAVLANGVIAEMGTHEALKKAGGLYWDLIRQQQREEFINQKTKGSL